MRQKLTPVNGQATIFAPVGLVAGTVTDAKAGRESGRLPGMQPLRTVNAAQTIFNTDALATLTPKMTAGIPFRASRPVDSGCEILD
nr:hypothetical protein CFP56_21538 [Quercus suber]